MSNPVLEVIFGCRYIVQDFQNCKPLHIVLKTPVKCMHKIKKHSIRIKILLPVADNAAAIQVDRPGRKITCRGIPVQSCSVCV